LKIRLILSLRKSKLRVKRKLRRKLKLDRKRRLKLS